jgi:hypothetical protein
MEYDLIDVCSPGRISFVTQLSVEIQLRLSLYKAGRRVQPGLRPAPGPFGKKQVMNLVGRDNETNRTNRLGRIGGLSTRASPPICVN